MEPLPILYPNLALSSTYGDRDIFSVPPATTISASPDLISLAAMFTASRPDPHTTFSVIAGVVIGRPALIEDCLATF